MGGTDLEDLEVTLLLEGVHRRYGYDFRDYARASIRRRIVERVQAEGLSSISGLQERALHDMACMERLLLALTVHATSMFRDPSLYLALRRRVIPWLRDERFIRIWHAGCSTGEEVLSTAILLEEEGLRERCRVYATDLSGAALSRAREGVFPLSAMREHTASYLASGGKRDFSRYYRARYDAVLFSPALLENVVFAQHNLVTDASFNEFALIFCRNVMIYFNRSLQDRVHGLLYDSLAPRGVLALGSKESLALTPHQSSYERVEGAEKLFRKVA